MAPASPEPSPEPGPRLFFTADTHFGHAGAIGLFRRPFGSVAAMDAAIEANWNRVVSADDEVWHLGDVALNRSPAEVETLLERLHGRKHLVAGNNDPDGVRRLPGWASVGEFVELPWHRLVLCHYALRHWRGQAQGWINLHGHSHGRLAPLPKQRDVGTDCWDFTPVSLDALISRRRGIAS